MNTTPTPDYGEPWGTCSEYVVDRRNKAVHLYVHKQRVAQCVNACAGMADAAKEIEAMREAVQIAKDLAEWSARYPRSRIYSASNRQMDAELIELEERATAALTKLQPFIKP